MMRSRGLILAAAILAAQNVSEGTGDQVEGKTRRVQKMSRIYRPITLVFYWRKSDVCVRFRFREQKKKRLVFYFIALCTNPSIFLPIIYNRHIRLPLYRMEQPLVKHKVHHFSLLLLLPKSVQKQLWRQRNHKATQL